jgi:hypothetical protein
MMKSLGQTIHCRECLGRIWRFMRRRLRTVQRHVLRIGLGHQGGGPALVRQSLPLSRTSFPWTTSSLPLGSAHRIASALLDCTCTLWWWGQRLTDAVRRRY